MDRFSQLPEPLLPIIISHLPFKEAARNSLLSEPWLRLWRSTQNVEFNERFFVNTGAAAVDRAIQRRTFIDFVLHWMENNQENQVGKIAVTISEPENSEEFVQQCITFSLEHYVKHLALDFSDPRWDDAGYGTQAYFDLPLDVYAQRELESLALFSCNFNASLFVNFGLLKHISLGWIKLSVLVQETLLAQCRFLESLSLKKCRGMNYLDIRGKNFKLKLKTLVVDRCRIRYPHFFYLEAPKSRYLKFVGGDVPELTTGKGSEFNFFEELDLDLSLVTEFHSSASPNSILATLLPTRALTVCSYTLRVIINHTKEEPIIPSPCLTAAHLTLKTTMHDHEQFGIKYFLSCCPNLETLTIERCTEEILEYYATPSVLKPQEMWKGNVEVYECITRTLRMVEVKGYMGSQHELDLLSYLLTHGRCMEQLTVITSSDEEVNGGNTEELRLKAQEFLHQVEAASQNPNLEITVL